MLENFVDESIVLLGEKPFPAYKEAFGISDVPDRSEEILRGEFPKVYIYPQVGESFGGPMLQDGLKKAKQHGVDVMLKLDADMFLTEEHFKRMIDIIQDTDFDSLQLNFQKNTFVYMGTLNLGVPCSIFPMGHDPIAVNTDDNFTGDHLTWSTAGTKKIQFEPDDVMIHHLVGFFRTDFKKLEWVESLPNFPGWSSAPDEIKNMFV